MKKMKESLSIILLVIVIITIQYKGLFSDFIIDEENAEETEAKKAAEDEKFSKYIARNIRAEIVPDIKGAARITWALHKDSDDDYIIGRSIGIPDTMDKALKSVSIKVVPAGARTEVIDSNLKAGAYYYCVLARSKIMNREIELYANQNYTITPVIIEQENIMEPEKLLPQQVSLIYARIINNNQVRITWRGIEARGIVYTIYRGNTPLDSPVKFAQAEKINVITDGRESFTDSTINKSGTYYYAVTTKDISGNEDLNLIPDQSYTVSGIYVSLEVPSPVNNIAARSIDNGVKITWNKTSSGVAEYLVYRYSSAISDSDRISLATFLGRVAENETSYMDKNPGSGNHYYAVLTKFLNGKVLNDLVKNDNYTSEPVGLGGQIHLVSLAARSSGSDIELAWKTSGNLGNKNYKIMRKESSIKSLADLSDADFIAYVDINDLSYVDKNLKSQKYYYAIVPESVENLKEFSLTNGVNVTGYNIISNKAASELKIPAEKSGTNVIGKRESIKEITSSVDVIVRKYFLTGKYRYALSELENFLKNSNDEYDTARARLFIGRTLIELKNYKEAVKYLILKDVNDHYPEESRFWREYALSKITNSENDIINDNFR